MPAVVLWDIDGTLVRSNGARVSVTAFQRALRHAGNLADEPTYPANAGGKTDLQVALELLAAASIADERAAEVLSGLGAAYLTELEANRAELTTDLRVLPGVPQILTRLQQLGICQALLTGNLEPIARLKLACAGLDRYVDFDLGAYGSDNPDRSCLVPVSRQRLSTSATRSAPRTSSWSATRPLTSPARARVAPRWSRSPQATFPVKSSQRINQMCSSTTYRTPKPWSKPYSGSPLRYINSGSD